MPFPVNKQSQLACCRHEMHDGLVNLLCCDPGSGLYGDLIPTGLGDDGQHHCLAFQSTLGADPVDHGSLFLGACAGIHVFLAAALSYSAGRFGLFPGPDGLASSPSGNGPGFFIRTAGGVCRISEEKPSKCPEIGSRDLAPDSCSPGQAYCLEGVSKTI